MLIFHCQMSHTRRDIRRVLTFILRRWKNYILYFQILFGLALATRVTLGIFLKQGAISNGLPMDTADDRTISFRARVQDTLRQGNENLRNRDPQSPHLETNGVAITTFCSKVIESTSVSIPSNVQPLETITDGGEWKPRDCLSKDNVAIVIPYKNREAHLNKLLPVLHSLLQKQNIHYRIFVVEQYNDGGFNKGMIMNIAFSVADVVMKFDCVIFHDVDLVPTSYNTLYTCPTSMSPTHLSGNITDFREFYLWLVGGVIKVTRATFIKMNGYSNLYWGWGAEDDDLYFRMQHHGLEMNRPPINLPYIMLTHESRKRKDNHRGFMIRKRLYMSEYRIDRSRRDGLTTIPEHKILFIKLNRLYTHIMVDVGDEPYMEDP